MYRALTQNSEKIMTTPDFYLASTEGYDFEGPRKCWRIRRLTTLHRNDLLLIRIDPPLIGQHYGLGGHDIDFVIVATRHEGATLFPITTWPVYVHVARLLIDLPEDVSELHDHDFQSIAWAELYKTEKDARDKKI
jgi:hypothetical protein